MAVCESSSNARLRDRCLAPVGPVLFPKLAPGAAVFLDDAARDDEKRIIERWEREFPDLERQDHGCEKGCISLTRLTG